MSKQNTAVKIFSDRMCEIIGDLSNQFTTEQTLKSHYLLKEMLELEKQQHEKTWFDSTMQFANESEMINKKYFDDYYTETFNQ